MQRMPIEHVRAATYKPRDAWWTVFLVDPYASHLVRLVAPYRWITPNRLTIVATGLGMAAAACFATADRWWLLAGALLFHVSFVIDCMDGKLARLQGSGTVFGSWMDYVFDRLRVLACGVALLGGQYLATDRPVFLMLAFGVVVLDLFHYLNLLQMSKVKIQIRTRLAEAREAHGLAVPEMPETDEVSGPNSPSVIYEMSEEFQSRFSRYVRIRRFLLNNRIRPRVISGIEFQMAVFIIGPLFGPAAIAPVTAVASGLLLLFEVALVYKLWLAAAAFGREIAALDAPVPCGATAGHPSTSSPPAEADLTAKVLDPAAASS